MNHHRPSSVFLLMLALVSFSLAEGVLGNAGAVDAALPEMPVRGIIRSIQRAEISTSLSARAKIIHVRVAEAFKKGEVLIEFDCEQLEANLQALQATHEASKVSLASYRRLLERGAGGRHDVRLAEIQTEKTAAEMRALAARLKLCTVAAPFDGRVFDLSLQQYETPQAGVPFMSLVGSGAFEIDLIVPSRWLTKVSPETKFKLTIDETGIAYAAVVNRIGAAVDPVSQTIKIIATFLKPDERVLPGMSGIASFAFADEVQ